jgi:DNA polymerase-3 subunit delta'
VWQVVGHNRPLSLLQSGLKRGSLAHAYLFVGPPHVGKMTMALDLSRALNCTGSEPPCGLCDSCREITSSRTEIGMEQIKEIQHWASLPPYQGKHRVFIIDGVELLSMEASNRLLKTLEEPLDRVMFVLLATNEKLLPATVVSRCQRLEFHPLPAPGVEAALSQRGIEPAEAKLLSRLCRGGIGWAISATLDGGMLQRRAEQMDRLMDLADGDYEERFAYAFQLAGQFSQDRGTVLGILDLWLESWRDLLLINIGCGEMITNIDRSEALAKMSGGYNIFQIKAFINSILAAEEQLGLNANPRLTLEALMLGIPEKGDVAGDILPNSR